MGTPYSWHPGSRPLASKWVYSPSLLPDEAFSSWLLRSAMAHGCDPLVLTGSLWPQWRILTIDLDRWVDEDRLAQLSNASGISAAAFRASFLRGFAERVTSQPLQEKLIWPWVLALGNRNRKRTGGLQYCPACLSEDSKPYFRLQWRFAWHTGCERHRCSLLDRCWRCHAPLEPHRLGAEDGHVAVCATCKADLRQAPTVPCAHEAMLFQHAGDQAVRSGRTLALGWMLECNEWFELADFFVSMARRANRQREARNLIELISAVGGTLPKDIPLMSGAGIELLRTQERQRIFHLVWTLMVMTEEDLLRVLLGLNMSRQGLCPKNERAPALIEGLAMLLRDNPIPHARRNPPIPGSPRPRHQVMRMMRSLERKLAMKMR